METIHKRDCFRGLIKVEKPCSGRALTDGSAESDKGGLPF
jgi:hypothetical protein